MVVKAKKSSIESLQIQYSKLFNFNIKSKVLVYGGGHYSNQEWLQLRNHLLFELAAVIHRFFPSQKPDYPDSISTNMYTTAAYMTVSQRLIPTLYLTQLLKQAFIN